MGKIQYPIDGRKNKEWRVTSPFGWRTHPTSGKKSHHNGVDIWGNGLLYNEVFADGKVIFSGPSKLRKGDGSVGGFGYHTMVLHKIDGEFYISVYAHNELGSLKLKVGQRVTAGAIVGKMGASGDVTGKHLHFEIFKGKKYVWSATGKNFVDPLEFIKIQKAKQAIVASAKLETPENAPVAPVAVHGKPTKVAKVAKPVAAPVAAEKPSVKPEPKTYVVKSGDSYWAIAEDHPVDGKTIEARVKRLQELNENKPLQPGDVLKLY